LWTLSVEEQFYLLFPLIALITPTRRRVAVTILLMCAAPVVRYMYSQSINVVGDDAGWRAFSVYAASICHFDAFLMGSLIARCEQRLRTKPRYANVLWIVALSATGVYVVSYLAINRSLGATGIDALRNIVSGVLYGQNREVFVYVVLNLLACAVLVHVLLQRRFSGIFAIRALSATGRVSYGGYLFHALVLWLISPLFLTPVQDQPLGTRLLLFVSGWVITVAVAHMSFRWFEQPLLQWSRKRSSGPFSSAVPRLQQS
jgi:peptidoglycan/LPS O-acetylase OafA/YrhL